MGVKIKLILHSVALLSVVALISAVPAAGISGKDCHGKICQPIEEFCSAFNEGCDKCSKICDTSTHNYQADMCLKECPDYNKFEPLKAEIQTIQTQQSVILVLLIVLLALILIRYAYKCIRWLRHKRCITLMLKKLQPKQQHPQTMQNGKDIGATTIQNVMAINDIERAASQIYSVTAGAEGSVMTMTTPVSTRYPAENSTTPTTIATEYSYDNQALAVTPVSEKPSGTHVF